MNKIKYTKELLEPLVVNSLSIADMLRGLGLRAIGGNYRTMKKYIELYNLNIDHFTGSLWNKGKQLKDVTHYRSTTNLKKHFIKVVDYNCVLCGCGDIYNNKKLVLHLDHIDGNNLNNSRENLRLLCPNCHSQTETYCAKNKRTNFETCNNDFSYIT